MARTRTQRALANAAFIAQACNHYEKLVDACHIALWIRDRLQEKGAFGAGFEEWQDIEAAPAAAEKEQR